MEVHPTNEETLDTKYDGFTKGVDELIKNCKLAQELRADLRFTESRLKMNVPALQSLLGPEKLVVLPYHWNEEGGGSMVSIFYLGTDVSGYPGLVHGGTLTTMLDEGLASCAYPAMPQKVGMTANLQINYCKPVQAGQFLVPRAQTTKVEGRKGWAEGWMESLDVPEGQAKEKLVESSALFLGPRLWMPWQAPSQTTSYVSS
jgi:acyl-coenzyme A thioesterase PaaI-like protein